jgi:lysyl-tRNA synthetase class 2
MTETKGHLYPETAGVIAGEQPMSKQAQDGETSPFWSPQVHADRRPALLQRNRMKAAFRGHFEAEGFTEVECGALVASPGNEAHLHAFETHLIETGGASHPLYLHTSPEFAAKKLLAAGVTRMDDFARVIETSEDKILQAHGISKHER